MIATSTANAAIKNAVPLALAAVAVVGVLYYLSRKTVADAAGAVSAGAKGVAGAVANVNEGTPYSGGGLVGTLGNFTNTALGGAPQAIGEQISTWFAGGGGTGPDVHYAVVFPDGARHAIHASTIDRNGYTTYQGVRYRIGYNDGGQRIAVRTAA